MALRQALWAAGECVPPEDEPLLRTLPVDSAVHQLEVTLTLFGKNLPRPYVKTILIAIV